MKTLLLLRHAKSSWRHTGRADHDRPLNARGKRDAPRMGRLLRDEGLVPDLLVSSPARRARKTAGRVRRAGGYDGEIAIEDDLYPGSVGAIVDVLRRCPDGAASVLVVGHNPALEDFIAEITRSYAAMPTAALCRIELPIECWVELERSTRGELVDVRRPREVGEEGTEARRHEGTK